MSGWQLFWREDERTQGSILPGDPAPAASHTSLRAPWAQLSQRYRQCCLQPGHTRPRCQRSSWKLIEHLPSINSRVIKISLHRQRPHPYFWTSASLLWVNNHSPTRWQPSSQFKTLLIFRYLTNINTGERQCLFLMSPLFLKNTSSVASDAGTTKSSLLLTLRGDWKLRPSC